MAINNIDIQDEKENSYRPMANPDSISEFTKAATRTNIASGDTHRTIFGKICKFFADLGTSAFSGLANNLTTTAAGYGMDARQGPVIQQKFDQINSNISEVNQNLDGAKIIHEGSGADVKYYAQLGADAASKKLLGSKNLTLFKKALIMDGTNVQRYWLFRLEEMDVSSYSSLKVECTASFQLTCNDIVLSQSGTIDLKGIDTVSLMLRLNGASNPYYPITVELLV